MEDRFETPKAKGIKGESISPFKKWTEVHWKTASGVRHTKVCCPLGGRAPCGERKRREGVRIPLGTPKQNARLIPGILFCFEYQRIRTPDQERVNTIWDFLYRYLLT